MKTIQYASAPLSERRERFVQMLAEVIVKADRQRCKPKLICRLKRFLKTFSLQRVDLLVLSAEIAR